MLPALLRLATLSLVLSLAALAQRESAVAKPFSTVVPPFVQAHCSGCHGGQKPAGGLDLQRLTKLSEAQALQQREVWEQAAERLRQGEMPPPGLPRPHPEESQKVVAWIDNHYAQVDRQQPPNPGRVTARRLNRQEFANSVQDLLGVAVLPNEELPVDPYGYGFDNIGDVLSLNAGVTDQYLKVAERVARMAIPIPGEPTPAVMHRYLAERIGQDRQLQLRVDHIFPADGWYDLRTAFYQALKDGTRTQLRLAVDGRQVGEQVLQFYYQIDRGLEAKGVFLTAGLHRVEATITVLPSPVYKGKPPYLEYLQVYGPLKVAPPAKPSLLPCDGQTTSCSQKILQPLLRRAWRRPATKAELDSLLTMVAKERRRTGSFAKAMRTALTAILVSPHFLFRLEQDRGAGAQPLGGYELATRLSYFLWNSLPDEELLALAGRGALEQQMANQVRRMLQDPRANRFVSNFTSQWLQTRNLAVQRPDADKFPFFTGELAEAMRTETELFFREVLQRNLSILTFLDGRFTYLNGPLAAHYGIPGVTGDDFVRVSLDGVQRSGVLTHGSVLTVSSYPTRTSPVIRGKWVLDNLLNQPPPPPPPNVPQLEEKAAANSGTLRQQLEKHRSSPACSGCHQRMDPLGFGLENYDATGRWREEDASAELPNGRKFRTPAELKQILAEQPDQFAKALTEKLMTYALGRGVDRRDRPAITAIVARLRAQGYGLETLILGIVESDAFRKRQAEATGASMAAQVLDLKEKR